MTDVERERTAVVDFLRREANQLDADNARTGCLSGLCVATIEKLARDIAAGKHTP